MDGLIELGGACLATAFALYGMGLAIISFFLLGIALLAAVTWAAVAHSRGSHPWPGVPPSVRRPARLVVEIAFGLINPVLYLTILTPSLPELRSAEAWWFLPLQASAWTLLIAFWSLRLFGAALDMRSSLVREAVRSLLLAALACVLLYAMKDASLLNQWSAIAPLAGLLIAVRLSPLYLIPAVLLWDYFRAASTPPAATPGPQYSLFLLPDRASRLAIAGVAAVALVTFGLAAHRRSDASIRSLVEAQRDSIRAAAERYDVDPRLIASIVYVTHRDQLSPFRGALERLIIAAWARNLRREFGMNPPDRVEDQGTDDNPLLNRAFDISVGLAQIKPRTAQTASVLAMGLTPDELHQPVFLSYRDIEPLGGAWLLPAASRTAVTSPIPVPAERSTVVNALLDDRSNLATCALILALYQRQWESANPAWSLSQRPDILATLYQIGFARSKPHGAPRSNTFGSRVRQVYEQPWLAELLASPRA